MAAIHRRPTLPDSWSTAQPTLREISVALAKIGSDCVALVVDTVVGGVPVPYWYVVRFLDAGDKFGVQPDGQIRETPPTRRRLEVLAQGADEDRLLWALRREAAGVRAFFAHGYRPVSDPSRGWLGFSTAAGVSVGPVLPAPVEE